jgi:hypothetical protein
VHGARDGEDYGGDAAARRGKTLACLDSFLMEADGSYFFLRGKVVKGPPVVADAGARTRTASLGAG